MAGPDEHVPGAEGEVKLARELTRADATLMGVGALMGGGIFVLLGFAAGVAGPGLMLALFLNGLITIPTLMVYAELGSASDDAGGGYLWVKHAIGHAWGFLAGWLGWFSHVIACALYSIASAAFLLFLLDAAGLVEPTDLLARGLALALGGLFVLLNYVGVKVGIRAENAVNALVLFVVGIFVLVGLYRLTQDPGTVALNFEPFFPGENALSNASNVFLAMGITFIAFEGYEIISQTSEEIQDPRRSIPRAIWSAFLIAWAVMLLVAFIALGVTKVPAAEAAREGWTQSWEYLAAQGEHALGAAADQVIPAGAIVIAGCALLLQLTALNATIYSSSRVSFAMGRDGNLPPWFGAIHKVRRTPHLAVLGSGVLVLLMSLLPIHQVAVSADVMFLLLFLFVNLSYVKLRKTMSPEKFGWRAPLFPALPIIGVVGNLFLAVYLWKYSHVAWYVTFAWLGVGLLVYFLYVKPRADAHPDIAPRPIFATRPARRSPDAPRILALLTSPAPSSARNLAKVASALARQNGGEVLVLAPIVVPELTPLEEGRSFVGSSHQLLEEARKGADEGVPLHTLVRIGHSLDGIVRETVDEEGVSLLLMGSQSHLRASQPTTPLLVFPPCDLGLLTVRGNLGGGKVLVPTARGGNAALAIRTGSAMARSWDGGLTLYKLQPSGRSPQEVESEARALLGRHILPGTRSDVVVRSVDDPLKQVVRTAAGFDLVVVGASRMQLRSRNFLGGRTEALREESPCSVLVVRAATGQAGRRAGVLAKGMVLLRRYFEPE